LFFMALIGVTVSKVLVDGRWRHQLPEDYTRAVAAAGGWPVLLPSAAILDAGEELLRRFDGFLLAGGGDLDPALYGQVPHPATGIAEPERDRAEIKLCRFAIETGLPTLAVCRGIQALNVALGGDLLQDLPSAGLFGHNQAGARHEQTHAVIPAPGSLLARISPGPVMVNSFHHQATGRLGRGLEVAGRSPDGVVEAVWLPGKPILGVQWHPECYAERDGDAAGLFRWLVKEAESRKVKKV
jgi:putative glutamine amidotransferase